MAHLTKYTKGQLPHLLKHDSRAKDRNGEYIRFGNQEIDTSRTHLNYNLHERNDGLSDYEYIKQRGEKYLAKNVVNRSNVNWAGSWVITLPESLREAPEEAQKKFFIVAHDFLVRRYGYENIVSAYVHNDESTPHMHAKITPVIWDREKQKYRHSAKDMFDKGELYEFHQHLARRMEQEFGFDVGVVDKGKDKTKRLPNKSVEELKAETRKLNEIKSRMIEEASQKEEEIKALKQEKRELQDRNRLIKEELEGSNLIDTAKKKLIANDVDRIMEKAQQLTYERTEELMAEKGKYYFEMLEQKDEVKRLKKVNSRLRRERNEARERVSYLENGGAESELKRENDNLRNENQSLRKENSFLLNVVKTLQRAFDKAEYVMSRFFPDSGKESLLDKFKSLFNKKYPKMSSELDDIRNDKSLFGGRQQEEERER